MVKLIKLILSLFVSTFLVIGLTLSIINIVLSSKEKEVHQAHQKLGNERKVTVITAPAPSRLTVSLKRSDGGCGTYADVSSAVAKYDLGGRRVKHVENEVFEDGCLVQATFIFEEGS